MNPQKPAEGILKVKDYVDAKIYHVECECSSSDHAVRVWIELDSDQETQDVQVGFFLDTWTPWWQSGWNRFKAAWQLLTTGIVRQEHHIILNKQSALNFANVLIDEVDNLEKFKKSNKNGKSQ